MMDTGKLLAVVLLVWSCNATPEADKTADPAGQLAGAWRSGRMHIISGWPDDVDTLETLIPIDGWTELALKENGTFRITPGGYRTSQPLKDGTGAWTASEKAITLQYADEQYTVEYLVGEDDLSLVFYLSEGGEFGPAGHWLAAEYQRL